MVTQSPLRHYKQINKIKFLKSHLGLQGEPLLQRTTCIFSTNLLHVKLENDDQKVYSFP